MINRIELILKTQNLSPSQFADAIGIQRPTMSHILARRNNPSLDFVMKTLNRFPEICSEWLLTGKGQMLKLGSTLPAKESPSEPSKNSKKIEFEWDNELDEQPIPEAPQSVAPLSMNFSPVLSDTSALSEENRRNETKTAAQNSGSNSYIERIIVFFGDGTFKSYT